MNTKKSSPAKPTPLHVIRCGEVTATILQAQSNCGFTYLQFVMGRSWKSMTTGKEAHGNSFFDKNEQDLIHVVQEASAWIRETLRIGDYGQEAAPHDDRD